MPIVLLRFLRAGSKGYQESLFNACQILIRGDKEGAIRPNRHAAELCLEALRKRQSQMPLDGLAAMISKME